jgi:polyisoprenyl-phosphate glycosyltransferase
LRCLGLLKLNLQFWYSLPAGYAPAVIGIFFLGSVQISLVGLLGEYIGAVLTHVRKRPLVVERERAGGFENGLHLRKRTD